MGEPASPDKGLFSFGTNDETVQLPNGDVMHYTDTGPKGGKAIVFFHGYPTSSYLYRHVIDEVCSPGETRYRCIAVDLIGFGESSCPGNGKDVNPSYEADRAEEFIELLGLEDFAIVVHDWGGPIGGAAGLRHGDQMSHLILLNTSLRFGSDGVIGGLQRITSIFNGGLLFSATTPFLVGLEIQTFTSKRLPWSVLREYKAPYKDWRLGRCRATASLNLFAQAPKSEPLFQEIEQRLLTEWDGEAIFLWGEKDILMGPNTPLGVKAHNEWADLLPQAETIVIEGANHFMQEDRPEEIGLEIKTFLEQ